MQTREAAIKKLSECQVLIFNKLKKIKPDITHQYLDKVGVLPINNIFQRLCEFYFQIKTILTPQLTKLETEERINLINSELTKLYNKIYYLKPTPWRKSSAEQTNASLPRIQEILNNIQIEIDAANQIVKGAKQAEADAIAKQQAEAERKEAAKKAATAVRDARLKASAAAAKEQKAQAQLKERAAKDSDSGSESSPNSASPSQSSCGSSNTPSPAESRSVSPSRSPVSSDSSSPSILHSSYFVAPTPLLPASHIPIRKHSAHKERKLQDEELKYEKLQDDLLKLIQFAISSPAATSFWVKQVNGIFAGEKIQHGDTTIKVPATIKKISAHLNLEIGYPAVKLRGILTEAEKQTQPRCCGLFSKPIMRGGNTHAFYNLLAGLEGIKITQEVIAKFSTDLKRINEALVISTPKVVDEAKSAPSSH